MAKNESTAVNELIRILRADEFDLTVQLPIRVAVTAVGLVGLSRMVLHTVMHPYFNQTWGFMTMPFVMVLSWWAVTRRSGVSS